MRTAILLALLLAMPLLAGCMGEPSSPIRVVPYLAIHDAEPGRPTTFGFYLASTSPFRQTLAVGVDDLPEGWTFEPEVDEVGISGKRTSSLLVHVTPGNDTKYGPHALRVKVGDTRATVTVNVRDLGEAPLRAGVGTKLYYVVWYDNGTVIGSNDRAVHDNDGLAFVPREALGDNASDPIDTKPLKVYVGGTRKVPPPEPYNASGYVPVIAGFDARLQDAGDGRGMVAGETRAVRVPKELAYSAQGNESHVLFGEDLHFLIRIVSVDDLRPAGCDLPVCPPVASPRESPLASAPKDIS